MKVKNILMIIFGVIAIAINVFIIVQACEGVEKSSQTSMNFSEAVIKFIEGINPSSHIGDDPDKVHAVIRKLFGHFLLFGTSGLFTALTIILIDDAMLSHKIEIILAGVGVGLSIALFSEFMQLFAPGRYGLFTDVLIDFAGFAIFFAITFIVVYLIYNKRKRLAK